MMAHILRLLLLVQLLIGGGLAVLGTRLLHSVWLGTLAALLSVLLVRLLMTLNNFRLSWVYRDVDMPPLTVRRRLHMMLAEWGASMLSSSWHMAWPRLETSDTATGLPVLLLHGYVSNRGYWKACSLMLREAGMRHAAIDFEPVNTSIDDCVAVLERAIAAACAASCSRKVILLGHSMGGLIIRAYLCAHGSARVAHAITLGTPHHGTVLANFATGHNAGQMARPANGPSAWLVALAGKEDASRRALFTSIYSNHDNIIAPASSGYLPGAKNIALNGIGHVALASDARALRCLLDELRLIQSTALAA